MSTRGDCPSGPPAREASTNASQALLGDGGDGEVVADPSVVDLDPLGRCAGDHPPLIGDDHRARRIGGEAPESALEEPPALPHLADALAVPLGDVLTVRQRGAAQAAEVDAVDVEQDVA